MDVDARRDSGMAGILHETLLNQPGEFLLGPAVPSLKIEQLYMLSFLPSGARLADRAHKH